MDTSAHYYQISLLEIEGIGPAIAKQLIDYFGSAKAIFEQDKETYKDLNSLGNKILTAKHNGHIFRLADDELNYCNQNNISVLSFKDHHYPQRLHECHDSPLILYYKGNTNLNQQKIVSVVGTRNASGYGKKVCNQLIEELSAHNVLVVSGLAYGIDILAHTQSLNFQNDTIAVLAHGLDRVYPRAHSGIAKKIISQGGLLTEHKVNTNPDRENFPKRNRIVAGISDATIVIESAIKGGSMITANLANSYNRDVFAIPGRIGDPFSEGCNQLIKTNRAHLVQSFDDIAYILNWNTSKKDSKTNQTRLFSEASPEEQKILRILQCESPVGIDEICRSAQQSSSSVSSLLLMLEFRGIIKQFPGKKYELV